MHGYHTTIGCVLAVVLLVLAGLNLFGAVLRDKLDPIPNDMLRTVYKTLSTVKTYPKYLPDEMKKYPIWFVKFCIIYYLSLEGDWWLG